MEATSGGEQVTPSATPRFRQKPIPPPRRRGNTPLGLKSMGAPLSLDENMTLTRDQSTGELLHVEKYHIGLQ